MSWRFTIFPRLPGGGPGLSTRVISTLSVRDGGLGPVLLRRPLLGLVSLCLASTTRLVIFVSSGRRLRYVETLSISSVQLICRNFDMKWCPELSGFRTFLMCFSKEIRLC